jgi:hypothetical protein
MKKQQQQQQQQMDSEFEWTQYNRVIVSYLTPPLSQQV